MATLPYLDWVDYGTVPHMRECLAITENTIRFDGYFYLEDAIMPVERIIWLNNQLLHIEITAKKTLEDTSNYSLVEDDDDCGPYYVCFFPTAIIELTYRILSPLNHPDMEKAAIERITAAEVDVQRRNDIERQRRQSSDAAAAEDTESEDETE